MMLPFNIAVVLLVSYSATSHAQITEGLSTSSKLTLFLSAEDQQALEKNQPTDLKLNPEVISDQTSVLKSDEESAVGDHTIKPLRYDGIVMKGHQVLGMWLDGSRVSDIKEYTSADQVIFGAGGRLQINKDNHSMTLFPGDYYSPHGEVVRPVNPNDYVTDVSSSELERSETDTVESDSIESEIRESDRTDTDLDDSD